MLLVTSLSSSVLLQIQVLQVAATNVSINPGNATWTNGAGTSQVEVFFGPVGNVSIGI